jgi:hypothetical protein
MMREAPQATPAVANIPRIATTARLDGRAERRFRIMALSSRGTETRWHPGCLGRQTSR